MIDRDIIPKEQYGRLVVDTNERGEVTRATTGQPLLSWLFVEHLIDSDQLWAADKFYEWQWRHRYQQEAKATSLNEIRCGGEGGDNLYTLIARQLLQADIKLLEGIGNSTAIKQNQYVCRIFADRIDEAFNRLLHVVEKVLAETDKT